MNKRDLEFIYEVGCLRHVQRTWKRFGNLDVANLAEHTNHVMWIALLLAKHETGADEAKLLKMALVHDVPESRTGDLDHVSTEYAERNEDKAIVDIMAGTSLSDEYIELWREFEKRESIEAKILKDADNLNLHIEMNEQVWNGVKGLDDWIAAREKLVFPKLYTKTAKKFWPQIMGSNPHDWHMNGRNRFNHGMWKPKEETQ